MNSIGITRFTEMRFVPYPFHLTFGAKTHFVIIRGMQPLFARGLIVIATNVKMLTVIFFDFDSVLLYPHAAQEFHAFQLV